MNDSKSPFGNKMLMGSATRLAGAFKGEVEETARAIAAFHLNHYLPKETPYEPTSLGLIEERDLEKLRVTSKPIIRMSGREHVDAFFRDGTIRLGTFAYYQAIEQKQIGDPSEGYYVLIASNEEHTIVDLIGGGYDYYVLCCVHGQPTGELMTSFDHNASFEIVNRNGFAKAIGKTLRAIGTKNGRCLYSDAKMLKGTLPPKFDVGIIGSHLLDIFNEGKYFIKPIGFKNQQEFRFLWKMKGPVDEPIIIKCPAAVQYCRRVN